MRCVYDGTGTLTAFLVRCISKGVFLRRCLRKYVYEGVYKGECEGVYEGECEEVRAHSNSPVYNLYRDSNLVPVCEGKCPQSSPLKESPVTLKLASIEYQHVGHTLRVRQSTDSSGQGDGTTRVSLVASEIDTQEQQLVESSVRIEVNSNSSGRAFINQA